MKSLDCTLPDPIIDTDSGVTFDTDPLHCQSKKQTARKRTCEPSAVVLFGIDQEVVTLRGLYGNSGVSTDLRRAESILTHR